MAEKELSHKRRLFVEAYLANPNATEAARKAGYSEKTAYSQGQRLLKNAEIKEALGTRVEKAIITADEVLNGIKEIAEKKTARDNDKLKAYELLGKRLAMWTENHNLGGGLRIEIEYVNDIDDES